MGYTHYWSRPQIIEPATFNRIVSDLSALLSALEQAGSPLGNAYGYEEPELTAESIRFNGLVHCGHAPNSSIRLPWPAADGQGIGSNVGIASGTLSHRCCNGDCSYESVWFDRMLDRDQAHEDGVFLGCCKTAFRPYDLTVTAFLVIAQHHLGPSFEVRSDGEAPQWRDARLLCQKELGYGMDLQLAPDRRLVCGTAEQMRLEMSVRKRFYVEKGGARVG